ncbi:SpoIIE family protein phosphatase [Candidatus Poribacteria bacterium]|nr:SpoIIE family protein phosphatase [Candidatus Poribacteria bacterium]
MASFNRRLIMDDSAGKKYEMPILKQWRVRQPTDLSPEKAYQIPKLSELLDVSVLQQIQDWAAKTAGISILIRDAEGFPITKPSQSNEFCNLLAGEGHMNEKCRISNIKAAAVARNTGRPQKYTCHAGLTQFAASIKIEDQFMGTIVTGDRPLEPLTKDHVIRLAHEFDIDEDKLLKAAEKVEIWSEKTMNSTIHFLYSLANTLFTVCYQGYALRRRVRELTALLETSRLLSSALGLQEVLDSIAEGMVKALDVKACTIRLLDEEDKNLELMSSYNLSSVYLEEGPVLLDEHPICQEAMKGKSTTISDVSSDPRFSYPDVAQSEGLRSMLCVGIMSRDGAIGTVHLYTNEVHDFTEDEITLVESIANQAAVAIQSAKFYEESIEKQRIERELELAGEIQSALMPTTAPVIDSYDIKAKIVPCNQLSGDLYDFINLGEGRLALVIADVSGKGAPGAILMATTRVIVKAEAEGVNTAQVVDATNKALCADTRATEFVTMFYSVLDVETSSLTFTNAGHNPPILFREDETKFLESGGIPLGILPKALYDQDRTRLMKGDIVLFYTDGVTETMNSNRDIFGLDRLIELVQRYNFMDSKSLIEKLYDEVINFSDGEPQADDLTLIALKVM